MKGNNKGNYNSIRASRRIAYAVVILICFLMIIGSLVSCGLLSFLDKEDEAAEISPDDIVIERVDNISEYYADDGTAINTGVLTSYKIIAESNDINAGSVTYDEGYSEDGQTVTATAEPKEGYVLDHWMVNGEEAAALGSDTIISVTGIREDMNLVAVFAANPGNTVALRGAPGNMAALGSPLRGSPSGDKPDGNYIISTYCMTEDASGTYQANDDGGTVSGGLSSGETTPTQINAAAKPGYVFDHWVINIIYTKEGGGQTEDYTETSNPITIYPYLKDNDGKNYTHAEATCTAYFRRKKISISLASMSPDQGAGTVSYNGITMTVGGTPVPYPPTSGGTRTIVVTANTGYYVDNVSFTDSYGVSHTYRPASSNQSSFSFTIDNEFCKDDIYLHAEFSKNKYLVRVIDDPPGGGTSQISDGTTTANGQLEVKAGSNVTITSTPASGYVFDCFVTQSGTKISGTPGASGAYTLTLANVSQDMTITAKYKRNEVYVTVVPSPAASSAGAGDGGGTVQFESNSATDIAGTYSFDTSKDGFTLTAKENTGYKFDHWEDSVGNAYPGKQVRITNLKEDRTYTALFLKISSSVSVNIVPSPNGGGTVQYNNEAQQSGSTTYTYDPVRESGFTLTAYPNNGYRFVCWEDSVGNTYNSRQVRIAELIEDRNYTAVFFEEKDSVSVNIAPSPAAAGTVQYNSEPEVSTKTEYAYHPKTESGFTLTAYPKAGYKFVCWEDSVGNTFGNKQIRISDLIEDRDYTAIFSEDKEQVTVNIEPSPAEGGTVQYNNEPEVSSKTQYTYQPRSESGFTLTAYPKDGYKFVCWEDSIGNTFGNKQIRIADLTDDRNYTAVFYKEKENITISIVSSPNNGGTVQFNNETPVSAKTGYPYNTSDTGFTLTATPAKGYTFECWTDSDGKTYPDKQVRITGVVNDMTYTALFVEDRENVTVSIVPSPQEGGTVQYNNESPVSSMTDYQYHPRTETGFTLNATARTGYKFQCWEDSAGNIFNSKSVRISALKENRTYTAVFVKDGDEHDGLRVVAEPASGGHVRRKESSTVGMVDLTAYPNRGWYFIGWKKDRGQIFSRNIKVTVNEENVTYVGCFSKDPNFKATSEIVNMYFYNEKRRVTHPNYTVTRQTMENLAAVSVAYDKLRNAKDLPALHNYGAVASVREYFEGKLAESSVVLVEGILTTTKGEVIGTDNISDIDTLMNSAKDITLRKFGDRYDSEIVAAVYTNPPEGFDGLVRTYLWKQTDTKYKDNIYVMYRDNGSDYREMAAIVDEDGTVRFTLEDTLIGTEFVLVRVNINELE